jgi:hypothetical protein
MLSVYKWHPIISGLNYQMMNIIHSIVLLVLRYLLWAVLWLVHYRTPTPILVHPIVCGFLTWLIGAAAADMYRSAKRQ